MISAPSPSRVPRQVGVLPQWSETPRFEAAFWTESPLVDRSKLLEVKHIDTIDGKPKKTQRERRCAGNKLPCFEPGFYEEKLEDKDKQDVLKKAKKRVKHPQPDNLVNSAQINYDVVPPDAPKHEDNSSGILRAKRSNADHLDGSAVEVKHVVGDDKLNKYDARRKKCPGSRAIIHHLSGGGYVNPDKSPLEPTKHSEDNAGKRSNIDHLVGAAGINLDVVPEIAWPQGKLHIATHLCGTAAQVNPDRVPLESPKRYMHPPSNLLGVGAQIKDQEGDVLDDWWGQHHSPACAPSAGRRPSKINRMLSKDVGQTPCIVASPRRSPRPSDCCSIRSPRSAATTPRAASQSSHQGAALSARSVRSSCTVDRLSNAATLGSIVSGGGADSACSPRAAHRIFGISTVPKAQARSSVDAANAATRTSGVVTSTIHDFLAEERRWSNRAS